MARCCCRGARGAAWSAVPTAAAVADRAVEGPCVVGMHSMHVAEAQQVLKRQAMHAAARPCSLPAVQQPCCFPLTTICLRADRVVGQSTRRNRVS